MNKQSCKSIGIVGIVLASLLLAEPAAAFRCGNKLVKDGMHEQEVLAICGEPTSSRHLGYAIRSLDIATGRQVRLGWRTSHYPGYGTYAAEVSLTEYVYNLGPRKLMRRLVFEGGFLVTIETLGRGYID